MGANEVEVKFHIAHLQELEQRILQRGGRLISARGLETNLRFDTPDGQLRRGQRALRLRVDSAIKLTYKGPGTLQHGVRTRPEAEVLVHDLEGARAVLEGLGYVEIFEYEKYRTTYSLDHIEVMLDELPYGDFVELEGAFAALRPVAERLDLHWASAIPDSYHLLFERLQSACKLPFRDLTFGNFAAVAARIGELGIPAAD